MKIVTRTILVLAALASPGLALCQAQSDALVASYPFKGNARDASPNRNHGVAVRATLTEDRFGNPKEAYAFDGNASRIVVPDSATTRIEGTNLTIAAWVMPTILSADGERRTILRKMPPSGSQGGYLLALNEQGFPQFGFRPSSADYYERTATNYAVATNGWTHVAATYDGTAVRFYLNGNLTDALAQGGSVGGAKFPLTIGRLSSTNNTDQFYGALDEIQIYNRALTSGEVAYLFASQTNEPPAARISVSPLANFPGKTNLIVLAPNNSSALVTFSARKSQDTQPLRYAWVINEDDGTVVSTNAVIRTRLPVGTHRVTLTADDGATNDVEQVEVTVMTPRDAIDLLVEMINNSGLSEGRARNLLATLNNAANGYSSPNRLNARNSQLRVFQQKVRAQLLRTNPVLANQLLYASQLILNATGGR